MTARTFIKSPGGRVVVLLVAALAVLMLTPKVHVAEDVRIPTQLPEKVGEWNRRLIRYCHAPACRDDVFYLDDLPGDKAHCPTCGADLRSMSWTEYDQLPKDTQFVKAIYVNPKGRQIFTSIVLSGIDRESIHRPERCLPGQGNAITGTEVLDIELRNGRRLPIHVLLASWTGGGSGGSAQARHIYFAYWFIGYGRETHSHYWRMIWIAWDRIFRNTTYSWAYISLQSTRTENGQEFEEELKEFTPLLHAGLMEVNELVPAGTSPRSSTARTATGP